MAPNYSIYGIPLYWLLALVPHGYASSIIKKANNGRRNNANPRSVDTHQHYKKVCPAAVWARWERAEAAHNNALENAPLFIGTIIIGNVVGLSPDTLNIATGVALGLRLVYTLLYIGISKNKPSYARSMVWAGFVGTLVTVLIKAGNVVVKQTS